MDMIHQRFRRFAFAQIMLGIIASCLAERNPALLLIAGSLTALSWYVVEGPAGRPLPRWVTMTAAFGATFLFAFDFYQGGGERLIVAIGHFTMSLQIVLLYGRKENREYAQLLALSLMSMISASALSNSMIFGALLIAYCVLGLSTVLLFQLKISSDLVLRQNRAAAPEGMPVNPPKAVVSRGHRGHFRVATLVTGTGCALVGAGVFLLLPRQPSLRVPLAPQSEWAFMETGFSPQVLLRHGPPRGSSPEVALNLRLTMAGGDPGVDSWLLRGAALDDYNPTTMTWSASPNPISRRVDGDGAIDLMKIGDAGPLLDATVTHFDIGQRHLFTIHPATTIAGEELDSVKFSRVSGQVERDTLPTQPFVYAFRTPVALPRDFEAPVATPVNYARHWTVQQDAVRARALKVVREAGLQRDPGQRHSDDDLAICRALVDYLGRQDRFQYSLDVPPVEPFEDPVARFILTEGRGHCELFASAMAAMARSIGIPARVVTGYRASERNPFGDYFVVRRGHAHAWIEAEIAPSAWRTFDPSPAADVEDEHRAPNAWLRRFRHLYEHLEFMWTRWFVSYNRQSRRHVITRFNESVTEITTGEGSVPARVVDGVRRFYHQLRLDHLTESIAGVIMIFIAVGLFSLVRTLVVRRRRLVALQLTSLPRAQRRVLVRQLRFYLTMLDLLEGRGHVRPAWQSPQGFARELVARAPVRFGPVVALTEMFYEIRFGYRQLNNERRARIRRLLRELEQTLKLKDEGIANGEKSHG